MKSEKSTLPHQSRTAQFFFKMFEIDRRRFLRKKILRKSTGKVGNLDVQNTTVAQQYIIYIRAFVLDKFIFCIFNDFQPQQN